MTTSLYRYAIIGTGLPHRTEGATGFGMAHAHWPAFRSTGSVELVAISDLLEERMDFFEEKHEVSPKRYTDYKAMLADEKPDIVSICVWPHLHAEMTIAAAEAGVKAIHCEKPMALTWGDCKRMKAAADANGVKLTFNHQRRHLRLFQAVVQALRNGERSATLSSLKQTVPICSTGDALARHDAVLQRGDTYRMGHRTG
jgi:predicted dehydrogenase